MNNDVPQLHELPNLLADELAQIGPTLNSVSRAIIQGILNDAIARAEAAEAELRRLTDAQISEAEPDIDWLHIVAGQRDKAEAERDALAAEVERLTAQLAAMKDELAQYDLGEWEDEQLKQWLPGAAEVELIARLESRSENWEYDARTAQAANERLRVQLAAANEWRPVREAPAADGQYLCAICGRPTAETTPIEV